MILVISGASMTARVWKQERFVAQVNSVTDSVKMWSNIEGSEASPVAVYSPAGSKVMIDVTDYVRTYASTLTKLYIKNGSETTCEVTVVYAGLISPLNVIIPACKACADFDAQIMPPSVLLAPIGTATLLLEAFSDNGSGIISYNFSTGRLKARPSAQVQNLAQQMALPNGTERVELWHLTDSMKDAIEVQPLACGRTYAMVEWVSMTGQKRRHTFEVVKKKTEAASAYSLLPIENEYVEIKGRQDGFTLRMDGLNAYDMWYYADVLTSSDVRVSLDGITYARVQVTTKNVTIPDGEAGEKGKFEMTVNYKRYDAVTM